MLSFIGKSQPILTHSNSYANASIGPATTIIKSYIYPDLFESRPVNSRLLPAIAFAGIIVGQLSFGWISDKVGRKVSKGSTSRLLRLVNRNIELNTRD